MTINIENTLKIIWFIKSAHIHRKYNTWHVPDLAVSVYCSWCFVQGISYMKESEVIIWISRIFSNWLKCSVVYVVWVTIFNQPWKDLGFKNFFAEEKNRLLLILSIPGVIKVPRCCVKFDIDVLSLNICTELCELIEKVLEHLVYVSLKVQIVLHKKTILMAKTNVFRNFSVYICWPCVFSYHHHVDFTTNSTGLFTNINTTWIKRGLTPERNEITERRNRWCTPVDTIIGIKMAFDAALNFNYRGPLQRSLYILI